VTGRIGTDRRGVSPAVGVVLMIVIVVALAAVLGALALGFETPDEPYPQYGYRTAYTPDGEGNKNDRPYVTITLSGGKIEVGEDFYIVDGDGNEVRWDVVWTTSGPLTAGDRAHIDGYGSDNSLSPACEGEVYRFVHRPGDGETMVLATIEIDRPPVGNATSHC
jgi:flagellin-like protein